MQQIFSLNIANCNYRSGALSFDGVIGIQLYDTQTPHLASRTSMVVFRIAMHSRVAAHLSRTQPVSDGSHTAGRSQPRLYARLT
ncbi:hypothetical protein J6590_056119 [Homalodisca vitripennis]|nr:hypothetical protein J6590_056119 [Homalodisca vitripennis]